MATRMLVRTCPEVVKNCTALGSGSLDEVESRSRGIYGLVVEICPIPPKT